MVTLTFRELLARTQQARELLDPPSPSSPAALAFGELPAKALPMQKAMQSTRRQERAINGKNPRRSILVWQ
jgi:hypothetical protein